MCHGESGSLECTANDDEEITEQDTASTAERHTDEHDSKGADGSSQSVGRGYHGNDIGSCWVLYLVS